jgi:drug/metabolite transporter (DMT)-like permease
VLGTATTIGGALILLPLAFLQFPRELPGWEATSSLAALSIGGTAVAQLVVFRMLRLHGASRLSLVTYLMPPIALFYGALILEEPVTLAAVGGLALILLGVALGSGAMRLRPRRVAEPAPRHG